MFRRTEQSNVSLERYIEDIVLNHMGFFSAEEDSVCLIANSVFSQILELLKWHGFIGSCGGSEKVEIWKSYVLTYEQLHISFFSIKNPLCYLGEFEQPKGWLKMFVVIKFS